MAPPPHNMTKPEIEAFDAKDYWQTRLSLGLTAQGVGYIGYGLPFNRWMYRVRRNVFLRTVRGLGLNLPTLDVLDIGSGSGFYVDLWQSFGVKSVTAFDLTTVAVEHLRVKFPDVAAWEVDIGQPLPPGLAGSSQFNAVSAFDVLFHIVDDAAFARAITNISTLVAAGGYLLISDNFVHGAERRNVHQVSRSLARFNSVLTEAGFVIERRIPMFILMNAPIDTRTNWPFKAWRLMMGPVRVMHWFGYVQGALMYPLEVLLTRFLSESPTTELIVCRKED
jgi:SAM-dependent methyltransferase